MTPRSTPRLGVTLLEVVVVIAIVAVLAGLGLVAVQKARESACRADCLNRLRQQALAVQSYESATGYLPPGAVRGPFPALNIPDGASHGLWAFLLPHLDSGVAGRYRLDLSHDDPGNQPAAAARVAALLCPSVEGGLDPGRVEVLTSGDGGVADYAPLDVNPFLADLGLIDPVGDFASALPANRRGRTAEITDGLSQTLLIAEAGGRPGVAWSSPSVPAGLRELFGGAGGPHRGGSTACLADCSARFYPATTDLRLLARLATRAGGEPITD